MQIPGKKEGYIKNNGSDNNAHRITFTYLSQEDLLEAGCLDFHMAIEAAEAAMLARRQGDVIFPDKVVQIFNEETQERINGLAATLKSKRVCGMKWVSVFPPNVLRDLQNISALYVMSELENGFPLAVLEGDTGIQHAFGCGGRHCSQAPGTMFSPGHRIHRKRRTSENASSCNENSVPHAGGVPFRCQDDSGRAEIPQTDGADSP